MIHIAIISHGHEDLLINNQLLALLLTDKSLHLWIKDNKPSSQLKTYCTTHGIFYFDAEPGLGFGENNNFLYQKIINKQDFSHDDYFIVVNPDIVVTPQTIHTLVAHMKEDHCKLATINLFKDLAHKVVDHNIRYFPTIFSTLRLAKAQSLAIAYDKKNISAPCHVEWASGAFLAFNAQYYGQLNGFNPIYFMYFEDVDICYRSQQLIQKGVRYYPALKALHIGQHKNRDLISIHAYWFMVSYLKFLIQRYCYLRKKPSM